VSEESIHRVKNFWESNPLWVGESSFASGSREFFQEHSRVVIEDCFAGKMDDRIFPSVEASKKMKVLDAGCGIGFWLEQFGQRGFEDCIGIDISNSALHLAKRRMSLLGLPINCIEGNIESLPFENETFDHVNCQGVVHHTPQPERALDEIWRVLKPNGTANISVYFENFLLRHFGTLQPLLRGLGRIGFGLRGRGRESLLFSSSKEDLVRQFDGNENPVGVCYSRHAFELLIGHGFHIREVYLHFFPRRATFCTPNFVHRFLDKKMGFMIFASIEKKSARDCVSR
jgi:SAM-dependent methyltransferase